MYRPTYIQIKTEIKVIRSTLIVLVIIPGVGVGYLDFDIGTGVPKPTLFMYTGFLKCIPIHV